MGGRNPIVSNIIYNGVNILITWYMSRLAKHGVNTRVIRLVRRAIWIMDSKGYE